MESKQPVIGDVIDDLKLSLVEMDLPILAIYLFGSAARGNYTDQSDIDVLLVVTSNWFQIQDQVAMIQARLNVKYEVLLSVQVIDQADFDTMKTENTEFYRNLVAEGFELELLR